MVAATPASGQTNHGRQVWGSIQLVAPLNDDWFVSVDILPRISSANAVTAPITIIPPVISYRANESLVVSAGYLYAWIDGERLPRGFNEDRFFQQFAYRLGALGKLGIRGQTRIEQRRRSLGQDWNLRVAQSLILARPLTSRDNGPVGVVSTELYWNLNRTDWGARRGYDDLWTFAGVRVPAGEAAVFELGYLNQRLARTPAGMRNMNHALVLGVSIGLRPKVRAPRVAPTIGPGVGPRNPTGEPER
ncbi:hypothetical protein ASG29_03055 [Sphingomonas sp. Leaf412]|uniref:DUF2490 domain-containing protein n=1 Tax=Sphingomonas sp. Leaf412 TaxID=1736370 RepID=UPI0006FE4997|nr:DUF2490 domain-containing protein [Sphingomonas sp. Leaf412]KQT35117.1 hypothetical protein ASG29_03055 [Sphingomonas sp. Leaf412]